MEGLHGIIIDLALILTAAAVVTILFKKINQPVVLGYIVAGFLMSPNFAFLPTVVDEVGIEVWAEIGIIFLMFALGLEFSFHKIAKVGGSAIITAMVVMTAMLLIGYCAGAFLGWTTMDSIFLGGMISMSSTMIILKAYEEMKLKDEKFASIVLGTLVIEDIAGIFMMIILTTISVSKNVSGIDLVQNIGVLLLILVVILCVGIFLIPSLLKKVDKYLNEETLLIFSLGFCFLMVVIAKAAGFSEALGAFLAGSILAGTTKGHSIEELVLPIKNMFGAIFFISVGMLIEPAMLVTYIVPIIIITIITIVGQMLFSTIGALASGQPLNTAMRVGFSMVQVGEFSFILASLGTSLNVTGEFLYPIIVCVSVITTFTTPIFIKSGGTAYSKLSCALPSKALKFIEYHTSEKQTDNVNDEDWKTYLTSYVLKVIIGTASLFAVYFMGTKILIPYLSSYIEEKIYISKIVALLMIAIMVPIINIMCRRKNVLFNKLWVKSNLNRLPLMALRCITITISAVFLLMVLNSAFQNIPMLISIAIVLIVIMASAKSTFIKGATMGIEARFLANFNENILKKAEQERGAKNAEWVDDKIYLMRVKILKTYKRKIVRDCIAGRVFRIMFIKIQREDGSFVNLPQAETAICENDIITAIGSKENIEAYKVYCEKQDYVEVMEEPIITLKEFSYKQTFERTPPDACIYSIAIPMEKGNPFIRKSIAEYDFISKYNGIIVGVERELLPIVSPSKDFVILEDDIIWVMGTFITVDELIQNKIIRK